MEDQPVVTYTYTKIIATLLLIVVLSSIHPVAALTEDDVRAELATAYEAIAKAEAAGGSVAGLATQLDNVARKLPGAPPDLLVTDKSILDAVLAEASSAEAQGKQRTTNRLIVVGAALAVIAALGVVVWLSGSKWFWGAWLRAHNGWRVERT